jgi:hypothetical protein
VVPFSIADPDPFSLPNWFPFRLPFPDRPLAVAQSMFFAPLTSFAMSLRSNPLNVGIWAKDSSGHPNTNFHIPMGIHSSVPQPSIPAWREPDKRQLLAFRL